MLRNLLILAAFFGVILAATDSFAAERFRIGVTGSLSAVYDDNVELSHSDKTPDFITKMGAGVVLRREDKTSETSIGLGVVGSVYAHNACFNNVSPTADVLWKKELSQNQRLTAANAFSLSYDPIDFADAFGRQAGHYGHYANRLSLAYQQDLSRQLTFDASFANDLDFFTKSAEDDSYANRAGLGLDYSLSSTNVVGLFYEFAFRDFKDEGHGLTNLLGGAWRHYFTPKLSLDARVGGQWVRDFDEETYARPYAALILTHELVEGTAARLLFSKTQVMDPYTAAVADGWRCEARLNRQMSKRLTGMLSWFFGGNDYQTSEPSEDFIGVSVGLGYEFAPDWTGDLLYAYSSTDSDDETSSYVRNVVSLKVTRKF